MSRTSSGGRYDATDAAGRANRLSKHSGFGAAADTRMTLSGAAYRAASVRHGPLWPLPTMAFFFVEIIHLLLSFVKFVPAQAGSGRSSNHGDTPISPQWCREPEHAPQLPRVRMRASGSKRH